MKYIDLLKEAENEGIEILENSSIGRLKGLYVDNTITLNTSIETENEKTGILAEELGHYYTSYGDIRDQSKVENRKQEKRARAWGYERLVKITDLIDAYKDGVRNKFELAEYLDVTPDYIDDALSYYKQKYRLYYTIGSYTICFDPLIISEDF